jgi:hypothetical protein
MDQQTRRNGSSITFSLFHPRGMEIQLGKAQEGEHLDRPLWK